MKNLHFRKLSVKTIKLISVLLLILVKNSSISAQFSFHQRPEITNAKSMIARPIGNNLIIESDTSLTENLINTLKNGEVDILRNDVHKYIQFDITDTLELNKLNTFIKVTQGEYEHIMKKEINKLNKRQKHLVLLHNALEKSSNNKTSIGIIIDTSNNFRTGNPQAITGLNLFNNLNGGYAAAALELGGRLNNMRLSLPTKIRYYIDSVKQDADDTNYNYIITRYQRNKYLYFDFISRGLVSLDSIATTVSEYVNSTQGSLLTTRLNFQWNLMPKYIRSEITGVREPQCYFIVDIDARLVPIASSAKIDDAGVSFHCMPTFLYSTPAGELSSNAQADNFIIQLSGNILYVSNNLKNSLMPANRGFTQHDILVSAELRAGYYSTENPARNFSFFGKYSFQKTTGPVWTAGVNFSPQGKNPEAKPKDSN